MLPDSEQHRLLKSLTEEQAFTVLYDWRGFWARPKQLAPAGDWDVWSVRAGRGFGKTRTGSGWVHERAMEHEGRWIALVARTPADARDYMIEGPGGLLRNTRPDQRPTFEVSKRRLTWPNGSWATIYSDEEPDQIRGFSGDTAWLDEFAKYKHPEDTWSNLDFGMREPSGDQPRRLITSTPRPLKILKEIECNPRTRVTIGSSHENRANLDQKWFESTLARYKGTRLGRQEIDAEILDDVPGALWSRRALDEARVQKAPQFERVVVGVDPAATSGDESNETGIIVCGAVGSTAYAVEDWSGRYTPDQWARKAVAAYRLHGADCLVAESNQGGEMVQHVIRSVADIPVKLVHATRGKYVRAEPISALYEQGRVHHVGCLPELEDQMIAFTPDVDRDASSPDRVDALVWAMTELFPDITQPIEPPRKKAREFGFEGSWMG